MRRTRQDEQMEFYAKSALVLFALLLIIQGVAWAVGFDLIGWLAEFKPRPIG